MGLGGKPTVTHQTPIAPPAVSPDACWDPEMHNCAHFLRRRSARFLRRWRRGPDSAPALIDSVNVDHGPDR